MTEAVDTARYAVLGHPVAHSRSPAIHAAFAAATGERLSYERVLCPLDGFAASVRAFAAGGGRGCNVTVPFKFEALGLAAGCSERAARAGAANLLRFDREDDGRAGGWWADNTDGVGLLRDIEGNAGVRVAGQRVLLVGAGGGAAGVLGPLIEAAPARVTVVNRSRYRAERLCERHAAFAGAHGVELVVREPADAGRAHDIVVNASASSLEQAPVPVPASVLREGTLAVDLMYGPPAAGFLAWAAAHGAAGRDGLGMLVEQAAEAFFVWRGVRPASLRVLADLRRALEAGT